MPRTPSKKVRAKKPVKRLQGIDKLVHNKKPILEDVNKIMVSIDKMIVPAKTLSEAKKAYETHPAELVKSGKIPVIFGKEGGANYGCYQACGVLYEALKKLGLKPRLSRQLHGEMPHTKVFFSLKGELYEVEMFFNLSTNKVTKERLAHIKKEMREGKFKFIEPGSITYTEFKRQKRTGKKK